MPEPANLARHLRHCFEHNIDPRTNVADAKLWFIALNILIRQGALLEAVFAGRCLSSAFPQSGYIRNSAQLLEAMPETSGDDLFSAFSDDSMQSVQVVRRLKAKTVLFAFCGSHGALGMPLTIAHRWFGLLGTHVVYLRDPPSGFFEDGIPVLATNRAGTRQALANVASELNATTILCYGNSTGGFGALLYGLEMGAAAVVAFNAVVRPPDRAASRLGGRAMTSMPKSDLRAFYADADTRPRVRLVYAADNADDKASALAMTGVPDVTIDAVADCSAHDAHLKLIETGDFGSLLRDALLEVNKVESNDARTSR